MIDGEGYCDLCGTKAYGGICSNCHEEAYILQEQSEYITGQVSDEFQRKAEVQRVQIRSETND